MIIVRRPATSSVLASFGAGLILGIWLCTATRAEAGGAVNLTWSQATDCDVVTGFELLAAPITAANPNPQPTTASVAAAIPAPPCGASLTKTVSVSGVGQTRFWIRAVAGTTKSGESNSVDASLHLGKPAGLTVVVP